MAQTVNVIPVELTELRAASTASGGTALTTTATGASAPSALGMMTIPFGADYVSITPRNFAGCAVARVSLNPYLTIFVTTDAGATPAGITDISDEMQDGDTTDVAIDDLPTAGTGYIYVGAQIPFRGVAIDVGSDPNSQANDLTVNYWNGAWTDISDTDSTDTGASLAVDGTVVWTVPSAWVKASLKAIGDTLPGGNVVPNATTPLYWTRWEWSDVMDVSTDIVQMLALGRSTAYAELLEGQTLELKLSDREVGCIQGITDAGTANLVVNVGSLVSSEFE